MSSKKIPNNPNKFIVKLAEMIKTFPEIINWSQDGAELEISDVHHFTAQVLPLFFTTTNYKSFLRQLNMYNFSKMSKRKNSISFRHPTFVRGNEERFQCIRRRKQHSKAQENHSQEVCDSYSQSGRPPASTECLNTAAPVSEEIKQLLKEVREALNGQASEALNKLESCIARLSAQSKETEGRGIGEQRRPFYGDYLSMHRIEELAGENKQAFTESGFGYEVDESIFGEKQF